MAKPKRPKLITPNDGANAERTVWLAKLRRERREISFDTPEDLLDYLIEWGLKRDERNMKLGGVGRK